jgi:MIP family channel proteins
MHWLRTKIDAPVHLYPFHHVEVDDYWTGVYEGWRSILGELLASMLYVFASIGLAITTNTFIISNDFHSTLLIVSLGDGLAFMAMVFTFQKLSGGLINPAVTWAALITRRVGILRGIAYMLAQIGGGLLGALLISAATPDAYHGRLGSHFWDSNLSNFDGFLLITTLTGIIVFIVFATQFDPHNIGKLAAIPIGFGVAVVNLVGFVFVGPPINPARTLASAVVYGTYDHLWVYWAAPAVGSTIAALLYVVLFLTRPIPVTEQVNIVPTGVKYTSYTSTVPTETTRLVGTPTV